MSIAVSRQPVRPPPTPTTDERLARIRDDFSRAFAERSFLAYGLDDSWRGSRWPGGLGRAGDRVTHLEFAYGNPWNEEAPMVRVQTVAERYETAERHAARRLAGALWRGGADHATARRSYTPNGPTTAGWDEVTLPVDGEPRPARGLTAGEAWGAVVDVGDLLVAVEARRVSREQVRLVPVDDLGPYLSGDPGL